MDNRNVIIAAVLGLVLLEVLTLYYKKAPIEEALRMETMKALDDAHASVESIAFDGRDATLKGTVSSDEEREALGKLVSEVWDVRVVDNQLIVAAAESPPEPAAPPLVTGFQMQQGEGGALLLTGQVHDESSRNQIVAAVLDAFPSKSIDNQIRVVQGAPQMWVGPLLRAISSISVVKNPALEIDEDGGKLMLNGESGSAVQKKAVLEDLGQALPASMVLNENLVVVVEERDPKLVALEKRIQDLQTTTRIQFKINTANLEDLSKQVLNQVAEILKEAPNAQIEVEGHTDSLGESALNMALSQRRADAVRAYLITRGVNAARLTAVGYGPTRPVATNMTRQGRITNRRVVFSLKGES